MPSVRMPDEKILAQAQHYICHERPYFHRYRILGQRRNFSLFFMDRWYDWQYESEGHSPLWSRHNGLMEIACRESCADDEVAVGRLADRIRSTLDSDAYFMVPVRVVHGDGTPYVTQWLLDGIDADDIVYCTRSTPDDTGRIFRKPTPLAELTGQLFRTDDGLIPVQEIRMAPTIERILRLEPLAAYRAIFAEYGLRFDDDRIVRYVTPITVGVTGIDQLIAAWEEREDEILAAGELRFIDQSRASKQLQNRFHPVQHYLGFLLESGPTRVALGELVTDIELGRDEMNRALADVQKFASLLVQRTDKRSYELYLKYLRKLREVVVKYQAMNLEVQRTLIHACAASKASQRAAN